MGKKGDIKILESMPDSFVFNLKAPVSYAFDGERVRQDSLEICAPTLKMLFDTFEFRQMLAQACMSSTAFMSRLKSSAGELKLLPEEEVDSSDDADDADLSPSEQTGLVEGAILFSTGEQRVKMPYAISLFKGLCLLGCAKVNGKPLTEFQWNELRPDDQLDMFLQFSGVFTLPLIFPSTEEGAKDQEGR